MAARVGLGDRGQGIFGLGAYRTLRSRCPTVTPDGAPTLTPNFSSRPHPRPRKCPYSVLSGLADPDSQGRLVLTIPKLVYGPTETPIRHYLSRIPFGCDSGRPIRIGSISWNDTERLCLPGHRNVLLGCVQPQRDDALRPAGSAKISTARLHKMQPIQASLYLAVRARDDGV